jgi:hypothetical protein
MKSVMPQQRMSADVKSEIQLLDVVALTEAFGSLAKGSLGTVVEVLSDDAFMVEFIDDRGYTLAIETLTRDSLRKVWERGRRVKRAVAGVKVTGER